MATILHIALPVPVRHHFDYLAPQHLSETNLQVGMRVRVPFGRQKQSVGIIIGTSSASQISPDKLKPVVAILDHQPLFDAEHLKLLRWASDYYHYPLGELIFSTLPGLLKQGKPAIRSTYTVWKLTARAHDEKNSLSARAFKQQRLVKLLAEAHSGLSEQQLNLVIDDWRAPLKTLITKGWVERNESTPEIPASGKSQTIQLNPEQHHAVEVIRNNPGMNNRFLLDGITGSGKTEVYLEAIRETLKQGNQAVILVPEIGLTPQLIARFQQRIHARMVVLHSGLSDGERLDAWIEARDGIANIILGTRSAIWTPLHKPGLFIIDEEHDASYKQQESFRYSARDIAILRANNAGVPVVLGSATPSLETLHSVNIERMQRIPLLQRAEKATIPEFRIVDMRGQKLTGALSEKLINGISNVLGKNKQVLLYLNRRGYSPVLMCHSCGWIGKCNRCDIAYTVHKLDHTFICHHCGTGQKLPGHCPDCNDSNLVNIGYGTERLTEVLRDIFPTARILRIDRDSTRRKGTMEKYLYSIHAGEVDILVGTQMLSKGHHFPGITLVGIIDADQGLYSSDFRAAERMAQAIIQVSGRAGRANDAGTVMIQTHFPEHPLLTALVNHDYNTFARMLLEERKSTNLPPYSCLALLRAEAFEQKLPMVFLNQARALLSDNNSGIEVFGPFPAPVEKRSGKYRHQLLVQSNNRLILQKVLLDWSRKLDDLKEGKKIRWSLDVDPQEML